MSRDDSVVRLFVEYSLLDLPTEETPLSLPKPPQGRTINYNYGKGQQYYCSTLWYTAGTVTCVLQVL